MARNNSVQFTVEVIDKATKQLERISKNIQGQLIKLERGYKSFEAAVWRVIGVIGRFIGVAVKLSSVLLIASRSAIEMGDAIGKAARSAGLSAEALQKFRFAGAQAGASIGEVDRALNHALTNFGLFVRNGTGPAAKSLKDMGLTLRDFRGQFIGNERAIMQVANAIQAMGSKAQQAAAASAVFGEGAGPRLVNLLSKGESGIRAIGDEFARLGGVIDNEAIESMEEARAKLASMELLIRQKFVGAMANLDFILIAIAESFVVLTEKLGTATTALMTFFNAWDDGTLAQQAKQLEDYKDRLKDVQDQINARNERGPSRFELFFGLWDKGNHDLMQQYVGLLQKIMRLEDKMGKKRTQIAAARSAEGGLLPEKIYRPESLTAANDWTSTWAGGGSAQAFIEESAARANDPLNKAATLSERLVEAFDKLKEKTKGTMDAVHELGLTFTSAFEDAILNGNKFREVLQGIGKDLLRIFVRKSATEPLYDWFTGLFGRAGGGPVSAGQPYMVGERGPELFVPSGSGKIVSNSAMAGAGNGGMQFVVNIDARGADPGLIARLPQIMEQRDRRLMVKVKEYIETGSVVI
jgi:hypothetical protein